MTPKAERQKPKPIINNKIHTTTIRMPGELHEEVTAVLDEGMFGSFNDLLVAAVRDFLRALREKAVDEQFASMAVDENYQKVSLDLYNLFEKSALEERSRAAVQSAAKASKWAEDLERATLLAANRPSLKAGE